MSRRLMQPGTPLLLLAVLPVAICDYFMSPTLPEPVPKARTEVGRVPWDATALAASRAGSKLVYGADDRIDVYQEANPLRRELAAATCALMHAGDLMYNGDGTYTIQTSAYREFGVPACDSEPFGGQPVAAFCTGWVAGDDLIVTAGHCFNDNDIGATKFVFGFDMVNATEPITRVDASRVYTGVQVVAREYTYNAEDYCVIRVDRAIRIPGVYPLSIRRSGTIAVGAPVGVIGHPAGLPTKIAFGSATAVYDSSNPVFFTANLDTYGGNSGSPVFDQASGVVEGILVRGNPDYIYQQATASSPACFISNHMLDSQAGEESTKTTVFAAAIPVPTVSVNDDVNRDGAITAVDVQAVIDAALGLDISPFSGDVNHDGVLSAADVQAIINAVLNA